MQKSALKSVNVQRTGESILQMFAFSFLTAVIFNFVFFRHDSAEFKPAWLCSRCSVSCRFLHILRPPTVPRSHFRHPKIKVFTLIIKYLYLQIITSASESRFCVGKWFCVETQWEAVEMSPIYVPSILLQSSYYSLNSFLRNPSLFRIYSLSFLYNKGCYSSSTWGWTSVSWVASDSMQSGDRLCSRIHCSDLRCNCLSSVIPEVIISFFFILL